MSQLDANQLYENLKAVQRRVADAAQRSGRSPADVLLVAVSKTNPLSAIQCVQHAGCLHFGENRLEELAQKLDEAAQAGIDASLHWHMIGTIQSRKSREVVELWQRGKLELIHSVDTSKLARRLSRDAMEAGCVLSVLLEVNVSGEESKHGFTADELQQTMAELIALPNLNIQGLMTMAPFELTAEETRPVFRALRELRDALQEKHPACTLRQLSMGMTNDFEVAIEEGATIVRVGSAIFGAR